MQFEVTTLINLRYCYLSRRGTQNMSANRN